jgi:spermidine synthase
MKPNKLEIVAFLTGFGVLIIEIAGARLMAPYFGNTLFTWTAMIAVVLAALAGGYYTGGVVADRKNASWILPAAIFSSSAFIVAVPWLSVGISNASGFLGIVYGPPVASVLLFSFPSIMLGIVLPLAIKLKANTSRKVGRSAGNLYAFGSLGSIVGALSSGYLLIPYLGILNTFYFDGAVVALIGVSLFGIRYVPVAGAVLVLLAIVQVSPSTQTVFGNIIYQTDSQYYHIEIINYSGTLILKTDLTLQMTLIPSNTQIIEPFIYYQKLIYDNRPTVQRALFIGLGAGAMVDNLYRNTNATIDVVEIDPEIIRIAKEFFNLTNSSRINVINEDGRFFLRTTPDTYNMIDLDVYGAGFTIPYEFVTLETDREIYADLAQNGSMMMNIQSPLVGPDSCAFKSVYKTLGQVFPYTYYFPPYPSNFSVSQNIVILASKRSFPAGNAAELVGTFANASLTQWVSNNSYSAPVNMSGCPVLTDNNNPFEIYTNYALSYYCSFPSSAVFC